MTNLRKAIHYLQQAIRYDNPNNKTLIGALDLLCTLSGEVLDKTEAIKCLQCRHHNHKSFTKNPDKCINCIKEHYSYFEPKASDNIQEVIEKYPDIVKENGNKFCGKCGSLTFYKSIELKQKKVNFTPIN